MPVSRRPDEWSKLKAGTLERLPQEFHEALLSRLPQFGAIKGRKPGKLRVLSLGFHAHIAVVDPEHPYPSDFVVRVNGFHGVTTLLIQPRSPRFNSVMLQGMNCGPEADFFEVMQYLASVRGLKYLHYYDLILLKVFRPGCPNVYQWSTVSGTLEQTEERGGVAAIRSRACQEIAEELKGYQILGWAPLARNVLYQAGNLGELQHLGVAIGYMPMREEAQTNRAEGIVELQTALLNRADGFLQSCKSISPDRSDCILPDGKMCHALQILLPRLAAFGVIKKEEKKE